MHREFTGQTAIVTGAATGLGEAIAVKLYQIGAKVVLAGRDVRGVRAIAERLDDADSHPM
jgi:NADP-dependent 3-hydroxy acid dehydrogenase YdfG